VCGRSDCGEAHRQLLRRHTNLARSPGPRGQFDRPYGKGEAKVTLKLVNDVGVACEYREGTKSIRRCVYRKQLDLDTLVCTRGPSFPLSRLESRLMCPARGSHRVTIVFEPPTNSQLRSG
jgi:hypothetical protein